MVDSTNTELPTSDTVVKATKQKRSKKRAKKTVKKPGGGSLQYPSAKAKRTSLFPASSFEEALTIPNAIQKHAAGQAVRRLTLFDQLGKSPDSGPSRQLITNASKYGLIKGNYKADHLELTTEGRLATSVDATIKERLVKRFDLAVSKIMPFRALYDGLKGNRVPATSILEDMAKDKGVPPEDAKECVEIFVVNAKFLGILRLIAGAERIIPIEQALEECPGELPTNPTSEVGASSLQSRNTADVDDFQNICFYISPIGDEASEHRVHSDLFLGSLVEPALEEFGLKVVRADKIGKPGMISSQIVEHIVKARLVIADLSFHNPNVFYELALRHVCRLPTVQLIRKCDRIPFDLEQFRTIPIDTTSIFTMVPNLQTYRTEIAAQVRMVTCPRFLIH
jgi:hypothetical protein